MKTYPLSLSTDSLPNFPKMCLKKKQKKKPAGAENSIARKPWAGVRGLHSPPPPRLKGP